MNVRINHVPTHVAVFRDDDEEPESPGEMNSEGSNGLFHADHLPLPLLKLRPEAARSSTDPAGTSTAVLQGCFNADTSRPSSSHRNRSPYSRSHLRSRSSGAALSAPAMARSHSSPAAHSASLRAFELNTPSTASLAPSSPMRSPARQRSPLRGENEGNYNPPPRPPNWFESPSGGSAIESIQEDSELDITPRQQLPQPVGLPFMRSSSLRRRPASPLHSVTNANAPPTSYPGSNTDNVSSMSVASSGSNSPSLGPQRSNETYPSLYHYASSSSFSSIPSTPTSQRSRSPSITSLETIEDDPDLESEAIEAERIERLKLAAERAERAERGEDMDDEHLRRRSSLDGPRGFGFGRGGNRERKRWSVCGGERRADLDLETIWED